jgi:hypothetical protein
MRYNRKSVVVTASNDAAVFSLEDMKAHLRIDGACDDNLIYDYITTATEAVKQYLRRALLTETFVFRMDGFSQPGGDDRLSMLGAGWHNVSVPYWVGGAGRLDLPFPPLQSVTSLVTYDRANAANTFSASAYGVDLQGGRIYLNSGQTWPTELRDENAVEITYVAGYGSANIPAPIKEALRLYVSSLYDGTCEGINAQMQRLLAPYRLADEMPW